MTAADLAARITATYDPLADPPPLMPETAWRTRGLAAWLDAARHALRDFAGVDIVTDELWDRSRDVAVVRIREDGPGGATTEWLLTAGHLRGGRDWRVSARQITCTCGRRPEPCPYHDPRSEEASRHAYATAEASALEPEHIGHGADPAGVWADAVSIEFPATTIGHANDLCRQAATPGIIPLSATAGGRLGFYAIGTHDRVHRLEVLLRNRGDDVYITPAEQP